jgi:hypothetical protein
VALPELLANSPTPGASGAETTLAAAVTDPAAVSISVAAAARPVLQAAGQFRLEVDSEVMLVTGGSSTTTWTVVRGVEGTTAATHASGASVYHVWTAGALDARYARARGPVIIPEDFSGINANGVVTAGSGSGGTITGTDDSTFFKSMVAEALPGVLTAQGGLTVLLGPNTYYINGAPDNTYFGNASIPIPTMGYSKAQLNAIAANIPFDIPVLRFIGVPGLTKIVSPRTDAYSSTNGPYSIIGGPTVEGLGLTKSPPALPLRVEFEGITFIAPDQPVGLAVDLACMTSARVDNCKFMTTTTLSFETSGNAPANLPGIASAGIRMPISGSTESRSKLKDCVINGFGAMVVSGNWLTIDSVAGNFCRTMLGIDNTMNVNTAVIANGFGCTGCNYLIAGWTPSAGVGSLTTTVSSNPRDVIGVFEQYAWASPFGLTADFLDANGLIGGDIQTYIWQTVFGPTGAPGVTGRGASLRSRPADRSADTGTVTLSAGTKTVAASSVVATTRVKVGILTPGGTVGSPFVSSVTAGTGFTVKSTSTTDTSVVWWELSNP